jgi:AraC family transcriptional activator of tynA and feaB
LRAFPQAEQLCAKPVPLSGAIARAIAGFIRATIDRSEARSCHDETDIVAYLSALFRLATGGHHELTRSRLFGLIDTYLRANIAAIRPAQAVAAEFGVSDRTFHRIFADRETTFERHVLQLRVALFRDLLRQPLLSEVSIAALAMQCGFADAAHATRTFRSFFGVTPRDFRGGQLRVQNG